MTSFLVGKLPAHGDFVARGLAAGDREAWDGWGALAMDALRAAAGEADFAAAHSAAPAWRFVTASAAGWRAGAVAPSVDAVGRRFLVAIGLDGLSPEIAGAAGLQLADAAEAAVFDAVAAGLDADTALARAEEAFAAVLAAAVAAPALGAAPRPPGAWWTLGSADSPPSTIAAREPPAGLFVRARAASLEAAA